MAKKSDNPVENTFYKIHVKGPNNNGERDVFYAVWIDGGWYKRRYYDGVNNDSSYIDRNGYLGYDYEPLDKSFTVTSYEKMENQKEVSDDDND